MLVMLFNLIILFVYLLGLYEVLKVINFYRRGVMYIKNINELEKK